jgi:hypothetical protein
MTTSDSQHPEHLPPGSQGTLTSGPQGRDRRNEERMRRWEYVTTPLIVHNTAAILNNWGSEGWELVQVVTGPEGGLVAYLKRPVEES